MKTTTHCRGRKGTDAFNASSGISWTHTPQPAPRGGWDLPTPPETRVLPSGSGARETSVFKLPLETMIVYRELQQEMATTTATWDSMGDASASPVPPIQSCSETWLETLRHRHTFIFSRPPSLRKPGGRLPMEP